MFNFGQAGKFKISQTLRLMQKKRSIINLIKPHCRCCLRWWLRKNLVTQQFRECQSTTWNRIQLYIFQTEVTPNVMTLGNAEPKTGGPYITLTPKEPEEEGLYTIVSPRKEIRFHLRYTHLTTMYQNKWGKDDKCKKNQRNLPWCWDTAMCLHW